MTQTSTRTAPGSRQLHDEPASSSGITRGLLVVLTLACGVVVANLYYSQPLLPEIGRSLHAGSTLTSSVVVLTQLGYAAGLLFVVPLGDRLPRRPFACLTLLVTAVALAGAAVAGSMGVLLAALLVVGVTSVIVQVLVPLAADLAGDEERGRVVGTVMSGLLIGILASRTVAGLVGQLGGWRAIYVVAAVLMLVVSVMLRLGLPATPAKSGGSYGALMRSVLQIAREEPVLRRRAEYGALAFASFSVLWTSIAFLLAGAPFHYDTLQIGLFGLVGVAGAVCASVAGRLVDRGLQRPATLVFLVATAASFALMYVGAHHLIPLIAGVLVLDFGVQGTQVTNQGVVYRLREERSRLNTVYMTTYFLGGAAGSLAAAAVYDAAGWPAVCVLGAALPLVAVLLWLREPPVVAH